MADLSYLQKILEEKYGIRTAAELEEAIRSLSFPDLGAMTSTVSNQKE